jgi:hypothetical protein
MTLLAGAIEGAVVGSGTLLFGLLIVGAVGLVFRGSAAVTATGAVVMTYGMAYRGMAVFMLILGVMLLGVAVAGVTGAMDLKDTIWIPFTFGGLFSLGGTAMTVEGFRRRVVVTDVGVAGRGWLRTPGPIPWGEVTAVRYSNTWSAFVVDGDDHSVLVSMMLGGREAFIKACRQHLEKSVYGKVFKKYGKKPF